jgi:DNA-binding transcriptional MerR regulator
MDTTQEQNIMKKFDELGLKIKELGQIIADFIERDDTNINVTSQRQMMKHQALNALQQERQMITQLQMEGYTKEEAVKYYNRMLNGEKPWMDKETS